MSRRDKEGYLACLKRFHAEEDLRQIKNSGGELPSLEWIYELILNKTGSVEKAEKAVNNIQMKKWESER